MRGAIAEQSARPSPERENLSLLKPAEASLRADRCPKPRRGIGV